MSDTLYWALTHETFLSSSFQLSLLLLSAGRRLSVPSVVPALSTFAAEVSRSWGQTVGEAWGLHHHKGHALNTVYSKQLHAALQAQTLLGFACSAQCGAGRHKQIIVHQGSRFSMPDRVLEHISE